MPFRTGKTLKFQGEMRVSGFGDRVNRAVLASRLTGFGRLARLPIAGAAQRRCSRKNAAP